MKYLTGSVLLLLLLIMQTASAGQCRVNGGSWIRMDRPDNTIDINVAVATTPGTGRINLNGFTLECRYSPNPSEPRYYRDYWKTVSNSVQPGPKFGGLNMGLNISGTDHPAPVGAGTLLATIYNDGSAVNLKTYIYMRPRGVPGNPIDIRRGDVLGRMYLKQTSNTGQPGPPVLQVIFYASNDLIVSPSTCTINGNQTIDVNFDRVDPTRLSDNPASTPYIQTKRLNYSCPDPGISMPISITLKGGTAPFNSSVLGMSNSNLGTGVLRGGGLVAPQGSFTTRIYNSVGYDDVTFALVRRPGTVPATGPFSGSAVLVMGVP